MNENEKMKVLELLSNGLIDSETAEKLLKALDKSETKEVLETDKSKNKAFKTLRIDIESADGDDIKINIPLEFAKVLKNKNFSSHIDGFNIDIDEIIELASSGIIGEIINIDSADGDTVKIVIE